jgi:hypothetical protein
VQRGIPGGGTIIGLNPQDATFISHQLNRLSCYCLPIFYVICSVASQGEAQSLTNTCRTVCSIFKLT